MNDFPTSFYVANGILTCPNGDKVRSDDQGLFCLVDGARVPYPIAIALPPVPTTKKKSARTAQADLDRDQAGERSPF